MKTEGECKRLVCCVADLLCWRPLSQWIENFQCCCFATSRKPEYRYWVQMLARVLSGIWLRKKLLILTVAGLFITSTLWNWNQESFGPIKIVVQVAWSPSIKFRMGDMTSVIKLLLCVLFSKTLLLLLPFIVLQYSHEFKWLVKVAVVSCLSYSTAMSVVK